MRIGVDVGGTNTDAVLIDTTGVASSTKQPTTEDVSSGVAAAIREVLAQSGTAPSEVTSVMIGTTHFTNALVERARLDRVGIIRLASPSGEALPPLTSWPEALVSQIGDFVFLVPGGYEVDGREIAPFDEKKVRSAARSCRESGILSIAVSSAFAPLNAEMETRAERVILEEHPKATVSLSHAVGRLGLIERENGTILNAALNSLAGHVIASFEQAMSELGLDADLYISQNDGTLIAASHAARYPVMTIGSGPTNSMRGAAYLTGISDGIVMDVGGTTCDIGVLANGFPRESSISVNIGGVRTNFRMPDTLALGLGGGTRIHLDPALYQADDLPGAALQVGPDSVGYRIGRDSFVFGGATLTASDVAVANGHANFGDSSLVPSLSPATSKAVWNKMQQLLETGLDRMKTAAGDIPVIAVGGGSFLIGETLKGASRIVRPPHADVANAVGAAIAQIGAQVEQIVDYSVTPREVALQEIRDEVARKVAMAGGLAETVEIVDMEEVLLSYLPGRSTQIRIKAVGDFAASRGQDHDTSEKPELRHAH